MGHATRCIPVINALIENGFTPILASDANALALLQKEFPNLVSIELPSYNIEYAKNERFFGLKMLFSLPKIYKAVRKERLLTKKIIADFNVSGLISDNRLGVYSSEIPSVYITHQINVLIGNLSRIVSKIHWHYIKKFDECWVPDFEFQSNLSGKLGHTAQPFRNVKYLGAISRFEKKVLPIKYHLMVLLSGPEPQRTIFEEKIIQELSLYSGNVVLIQGNVSEKQVVKTKNNITVYNFMLGFELEKCLNESAVVLCRSGYTTVMDLSILGKKAFFVPTPGQKEQEYLAKKFHKDGRIPTCTQNKFSIKRLDALDVFTGFTAEKSTPDWKSFFYVFK